MCLPESVALASAVDRLWQMRNNGQLNDEEFLQKKAVILGNPKDKEDCLVGAVVLISEVKNKIKAIKAIRSLSPQLGLSEAKSVVDHLPQVFCSQVTTEHAEAVRQRLVDAGVTVQVI